MTSNELYRSADGRITVDDAAGNLSLRFNGRLQSAVKGEGSLDTPQRYLDVFHMAFAIAPEARRVLVVGLGGGVFPKRVMHDYPSIYVDVVELDPEVVEIAQRFFGLPSADPHLRIFVCDGRRYLEETSECYDAIVIDAYYETSMPFALTTVEFVRLAASRLAPGGVLVYNMVGVLRGRGSSNFQRFLKGVRSVFPGSYVLPVGIDCGGRRQNIVVMGSETVVHPDELRRRARDRVGGTVQVPGFEAFGDCLDEGVVLSGARPLFDADTPEDGILHA
jgi:spermidine synthase